MISQRRTYFAVSMLVLAGAAIAVYFIVRARTVPVDDKNHTVTIESAPYNAPLVLAVHTVYPGANAQIVAETVAAPIEQQVNGVEHMLAMSSVSANDGSYTLQVTFAAGTNLDLAQMLVQNRISLALPVMPGLVQHGGISVRKKSPLPLMLVSLTAPGNRYDELYLSNYSTIQIKDELARVSGVAETVLFGQRNYQMRITLDPDKLAARELTVTDVTKAITQQNIQLAAGPIGLDGKDQQFQLNLTTLGRLTEPEQLANIILKAAARDQLVHLKDVARVELVRNDRENSSAVLNGKPAAILCLYPLPNAKPADVSRAVSNKIAELRINLPDGLELEAAFDFSSHLEEPNNPATSEHLVIDAELPVGISVERTATILERAADSLRKAPGVQDVLSLTEHPFSPIRSRPCLVVRLAPKDQRQLGREQIAENLRIALRNQLPESKFRISVPSTADGFPIYGFPIAFAIEDHGDHGFEMLRKHSEDLIDRLIQSGEFSDIDIGSGQRRIPLLSLNIDRTKCIALELNVSDVLKTAQAFLGANTIDNFNQFGRTWQVNLQLDPRLRVQASDIQKLLVKNKQNQPFPLGTVMDVREVSGPMVIERHNMYPIARVTANLAADVPRSEAKSLTETLAGQTFDRKQFKLIWQAP